MLQREHCLNALDKYFTPSNRPRVAKPLITSTPRNPLPRTHHHIGATSYRIKTDPRGEADMIGVHQPILDAATTLKWQ